MLRPADIQAPAELHVDLEALADNVRAFRVRLPSWCALAAMVKDDGFGMGASRVAACALSAGASWLGVARAFEAMDLRRAGMRAEILNVGPAIGVPPPVLAEAGIVQSVGSIEEIERLDGDLHGARRILRVHLAIDTDMKREGAAPEEAVQLATRVQASRWMRLEGLWTHFAHAEDAAWDAERGRRAFRSLVEAVQSAVGPFRWVHTASSAVVARDGARSENLVRPGIGLYGVRTSAAVPLLPGVRPVASLWAQVTRVRRVRPGDGVGYGHLWTAPRSMRIATLAIGYGDGLFRSLAERGAFVSLRGQHAALVGTMSMDSVTTALPDDVAVTEGDAACIFGAAGAPSVEDLARMAGTNPHEILVRIAPRVRRRYFLGEVRLAG